MASEVEICNRGLQKLGAKRITSLTDGSVNARACLTAYAILRDAELRKHRWSFAIQRFQLAASPTAPLFGRQAEYPLPAGFLKLLDPDPDWNYTGTFSGNATDWNGAGNADDLIIEGRSILTNMTAPLNVRLVMQIIDPNLMDPLFRESIAAKLAEELCEELTQSNQKKESARTDYKEAISAAKKANAIELPPQQAPTDTWITTRF
jgi:hypothetical protein